MRISGTTLLPLALLAILAALTFWLERVTQGTVVDGSKARHDPDFFVENFSVRRFNPEGMLQHTLHSRKMLHYPDDESTDLVAPRLTYHRAPPTRVSSDTAWLDRDGKHVRLDGNVRVVRGNTNGGPETVLSTSVLHAVPDDEVAHTDAPVTITQGMTVIKGTGLHTDNKTQISVLSGRAHGIIYNKEANTANTTNPERIQNEPQTPAAQPSRSAAQPSRPAAGVRGKSRPGKTRQPRSRPNNRR